MPILQAILLRQEQRCRWIAVFVELFGEAPFGAGEIDESEGVLALRRRPPIFLLRRIAHQTQALADLFALARIVDEQREGAAVHRQLGLARGIESATPCSGWQVV